MKRENQGIGPLKGPGRANRRPGPLVGKSYFVFVRFFDCFMTTFYRLTILYRQMINAALLVALFGVVGLLDLFWRIPRLKIHLMAMCSSTL